MGRDLKFAGQAEVIIGANFPGSLAFVDQVVRGNFELFLLVLLLVESHKWASTRQDQYLLVSERVRIKVVRFPSVYCVLDFM